MNLRLCCSQLASTAHFASSARITAIIEVMSKALALDLSGASMLICSE
jgi:hypothetical protein